MVKTGFGAILHKRFEFPMPEMRAWEIDTLENFERAQFDDPRDRRRFFAAGDNQIAGVGDGFQRNSPAWIETVKSGLRMVSITSITWSCQRRRRPSAGARRTGGK